MTVTITQEEMNILNLNGCSTQAVSDNIRLRRLNGETDEQIRQSYDNLIGELRPVTHTNINDTQNIKKWNEQGGITPYEYGKRTTMEFYGTYNNIDNNANLSKAEQAVRNFSDTSGRNSAVERRIEQNKLNKEQREQRIQNGTASILDKVGSALDSWGQASYEAQQKTDVPSPITNIDKTQKIGFTEALGNGYLSGGWVPFVGGYIEGADNKKQREIQEHIIKGEPIRQDELDFLNKRIQTEKEKQVRGYTIAGSIGENFLPSLIRFGTEIAMGGWVLKSLGLTGAGTGAGLNTYNALRGINASKKVALAGGKVAKGLTNMAVAGAVNTALPTSYNDTFDEYQKRRLAQSFELTNDGRVYFKEADEKPAITFLKSMGSTFTMFASEYAGELIGMPIKGLSGAVSKYSSPISKYLFENKKLADFVKKTIPELSAKYEQFNNMPIKKRSMDWLKDKVKYDGFIEEMGEEVVEDLLNITLGTSDQERTFENYIKAIVKSPDEWAVIAGMVALQGGALSVSSHLLGSYLEKNGADDDTILQVFDNLKESGIKEEVNKLVQNGEINVDNINALKNQQDEQREQVENTVFEKLSEGGNVNKNIAFSASKLAGQFFNNFGTNTVEGNKKFNEWFNKLSVKYNIPVEQNQSVLNQDDDKLNTQDKYINKLVDVPATNRHYEGGYTSPAVNKLLDRLFNGENIDRNTLNDNMQKVYDDFKSGKYKRIEGTPARQEYRQVPNPNYKPVYLNTAESRQDIIDDYENKTFVERKGKGYRQDYSMSNNAKSAYNKGSMPSSKWNKNNIIQKITELSQQYSIPIDIEELNDLNLNQLKQYLKKDGYHHTSKYYNSTDFYKVDIEKLLDNAEQNFIMSDFDNVEEQEYIKIKVNPDLKNRMNERVEAKHIKDVDIDYNRTNSEDIKKDIKTYWFGEGKTNTTVINNKKEFILNSHSAKEMFHKTIRNINDNKGNEEYRKTLYNILANTKELFETSIPILSYNEAKNVRLRDNLIIHRYANLVNTPISNFVVIYTIKEQTATNKRENITTRTFTIYDLGAHKKSSSGELAAVDKISSSTPSGTNIIMADLIDFVKGKVIEKAKNRNIERRNKEQKQKENNNNISFQSVADNRNLLMVHATKSYRLDDVLESGTLVAPSFAIVKKGTNHFNFGDIIFIRKPNKIDYQNDNIYDRDIYSPRLPQPDYMTEDGVFVSAYDYESMQRLYNKRPADFKRLYHSDSFDEYFKGAKKVINMGFTPSGNRKTIPYTNKNLLEYVKKEKLKGGENFGYGLSSLLAKLAEQQKNLSQLKQTAENNLNVENEELSKKWEDIKKEYDKLGDKTAEYYYDKYSFYEVQDEAFFAIEKNNKRKINDIFVKQLPTELIKEIKDFIKKAKELPRAYFEAKPIREVELSEFSYALAQKGILTGEQIKKLNEKGIQVKEYTDNNIDKVLNDIDSNDRKIFFQSALNPNDDINKKLNQRNILFQKTEENKKISKTIKSIFDNIISKFNNDVPTIKDLIPLINQLEPIANFFDSISNVKVHFSEKDEHINGFYSIFTNSIYLNTNSFKNSNIPVERIHTFLHECQHAKQKVFYDRYKKELKNSANLTQEEINERKQYIKNFKDTLKANRDYSWFEIKYKKENDRIRNLQKGITFEAFLKLLDETKYKKLKQIYNEGKKLYNNYRYSPFEVEARNVADELIDILGLRNNYESTKELSSDAESGRFDYSKLYEGRLYDARSTGRTFEGSNEIGRRIQETAGNETEKRLNNILFQSAFHGSPHKFDKFSTEHIGTGEGAQAHGWGLYFAGNKDVSENYREILSGDTGRFSIPVEIKYNGKDITEINNNADLSLALEEAKNNGIDAGIQYLNNEIQNRKDYIENYKNAIKKIKKGQSDYFSLQEYQDGIKDSNEYIKTLNELIDFVKSIDMSKLEVADRNKGQLYEVDIPENDVLLDEDKKYSEQPAKVQEAITKLFNEGGEKYQKKFKDITKHDYTGRSIYKAIGSLLLNDEELHTKNIDTIAYADKLSSIKLNEYGIKGITYDGHRDGRCYVIFDDKAINVINTFYQESDDEEGMSIAGFSYMEIMNRLTELNDRQRELVNTNNNQEELDKVTSYIHILEDALALSWDKPETIDDPKYQDLYLNTYYIMNNQDIPDEFIDSDKKSQRTFEEYSKLHKDKLEEEERNYRGYFEKTDDQNIITIMSNQNASTALHELGHLFLDGLNELAEVDEKARKMLDEVNKKLGAVNGVYTVEQQEKFARSFEAYLYQGKAPNNTLRQVFEEFKKWLRSVYNHVTSIPDADISPEVQEMFDKMFGSDSYYEEKKATKELLKKIKNAERKEKIKKVEYVDDSQLTETQKRHKAAAYSILSRATNKSIKYLKTIFETNSPKKSFIKKREAIENLVANADDKITSKDGFLPEWTDFFTDTGVSYDTQEVGGDFKLAEQALDVIINKRYADVEKSLLDHYQERADYFEHAIDTANRQYKLLINSFKNEDRNVALSAFYEWIDSLDSEIKQDYEDKFTYDMALIERNEHIDKFDKAKRNIISAALDAENQYKINDNEKYKQVVLEIMKNLDFLQPADKAKLTTNILDVGSTSMLMSQIDSILDIAKTMEDINYRRKLEHDIHKELQTTKNVRKNGRTVGKYNYKNNKLFEELRNLDRLSPELANEYRLENKKFAEAEDNGLTYKDKLINKFLSYKAGGRTFADTDLMKELYDEITKIKLAGKASKSEQELQDKLTEEKDIDELIDIINNKKSVSFIRKIYINGVANLESALNAIFNDDIKTRYGSEILYDETQAQAWQYEQKQNFEKAVAQIYKLPQWNWDSVILKYLNEKHTYNEYRRKYDKEGNVIKLRNIDRTLTKMDIIQAYIWYKNDILEKRLINQFGEDQLNSMFDELSPEDIKLAELMMRTAQSYYPMVNKAFIEKYGLDLPKVSCYFPSTPERGSEVDLYNDYSSKSLGNGFTKSRAASELIPMDFHNPLTTLYNHIEGVAKFTFMSKNLDIANIRFRNNDLKRAIIAKFGDDVYRTLEQSLINITYKREAPVFNGYQKVLDFLTTNWITANVSIKPIVGLKQLLSANNYAVDMPYMTWQIDFLKALAHPKATIDYMMNIPYLKARYGGGYSNEFLKQSIENSAYAKTKKFKDMLNLFIKMGDIGAIIFGGKPYIDYLIKEKGMSEADAIKQFILSTNRSQQSSAVSSLSNFQVAATRNPIGKLFIAYKNSPQQYIRMCGDAIISASNGDITKTKAMKMLFQYGYLQPFFYAMATSGSLLRLLFAGDDDDLLKDLKLSLFNLNSNALPILGDIYQYALNRLVFKEKYIPTSTPLLGDIQNEITKISKDDVSAKDFFEAIGYIVLHAGLGINTNAITNEISGTGDIITGDVAKGSLKVLGYTDKRAENITK